MNDFLDSLSNLGSTAADVVSAVKGNDTRTAKKTATTSGVPSAVWYIGGGIVALLVVLFVIRK